MNPLSKYRDHEISLEIEEARRHDAVAYFNRNHDMLVSRCCPICESYHSKSLEPYANSFPISKCERCNLIYAPKILHEESLASFYSDSTSAKLLNKFYEQRNKNTENLVLGKRMQDVLCLAHKICSIKNQKEIKLLEIGCGDGSQLKTLSEALSAQGIKSTLFGVEPNQYKRNKAEENGISIVGDFIGCGRFDCSEFFDIVIAFELIEHLNSPKIAMGEIYKSLNPGGAVILSTPNIEGLENIVTGYNGFRVLAHAICPPHHIQGFSRTTLSLLAFLTGFHIEEIKAVGSFDVYAVDYYAKNKMIKIHDEQVLNIITRYGDNQDHYDGIQAFTNFLNGSSTLTAVFVKGSA